MESTTTPQTTKQLVKTKLKIKPKQLRFLELYYDPKSETFGNIYQSGIKAGFSKSYANTMTTQQRDLQWLKDAKAILTNLEPEHIISGLEEEARKATSSRDRISALRELGKIKGLYIERSINETNVTFTNAVPRPTIEAEVLNHATSTAHNQQ